MPNQTHKLPLSSFRCLSQATQIPFCDPARPVTRYIPGGRGSNSVTDREEEPPRNTVKLRTHRVPWVAIVGRAHVQSLGSPRQGPGRRHAGPDAGGHKPRDPGAKRRKTVLTLRGLKTPEASAWFSRGLHSWWARVPRFPLGAPAQLSE